MELDRFDLRLLELMQVDARTPVPSLAEAVGLSAPACYRRIRRLRNIGAIEREVAVVRPATFGWGLTMFVLVTLDREGPRVVDQVMRKLASIPQVIGISLVTGDFAFVVRLLARDMDDYEALTQRMFTDDEQVREFRTLVVRKEMNKACAVPIAAA